MRIYVTGSHSVGKSTLCRYISNKYNLPFINEVARSVLAEKELNIEELRINLDIVDNYQQEIFYRQIAEEKKHENFVSDRTFCNLAYTASHSRVLHKLFFTQELKDYVDGLKKKDVVMFFIRPCKDTLKNDGVRESVTWDGIISIDAQIKFMLECFGLNYININTGSMQERIKLIDSVLAMII